MLRGKLGRLRRAKAGFLENKKAAVFGCYGWSGEGNKILAEELKNAGFQVVEEGIRSLWNPEKDDLDKSEALVKALLLA